MTEARQATIRLRQRYSEWTKHEGKPCLRWRDAGAEEAYILICQIWRFNEATGTN